MKEMMCISMDKEMYRKVHKVCMIKKDFFGDKEQTMSHMVDVALREYFDNHKQEIDEMINDYHDQGGCAEL